MRKIIKVILMISLGLVACESSGAADLTGKWQWTDAPDALTPTSQMISINLQQEANYVHGTYCEVWGNGQHVDCGYAEENIEGRFDMREAVARLKVDIGNGLPPSPVAIRLISPEQATFTMTDPDARDIQWVRLLRKVGDIAPDRGACIVTVAGPKAYFFRPGREFQRTNAYIVRDEKFMAKGWSMNHEFLFGTYVAVGGIRRSGWMHCDDLDACIPGTGSLTLPAAKCTESLSAVE